jgi:hypothetical protein
LGGGLIRWKEGFQLEFGQRYVDRAEITGP